MASTLRAVFPDAAIAFVVAMAADKDAAGVMVELRTARPDVMVFTSAPIAGSSSRCATLRQPHLPCCADAVRCFPLRKYMPGCSWPGCETPSDAESCEMTAHGAWHPSKNVLMMALTDIPSACLHTGQWLPVSCWRSGRRPTCRPVMPFFAAATSCRLRSCQLSSAQSSRCSRMVQMLSSVSQDHCMLLLQR